MLTPTLAARLARHDTPATRFQAIAMSDTASGRRTANYVIEHATILAEPAASTMAPFS